MDNFRCGLDLMIVEVSLEFSPLHIYPEITKCYGGSIERENITHSLSVVIVLVLSRHPKRTFRHCGKRVHGQNACG